jgi:hypothetical protein
MDDRTQADYPILAAGDVKALEIDPLCGQPGVTTGSVQWHGQLPHRPGTVVRELRDQDRRHVDDKGAPFRPGNDCR